MPNRTTLLIILVALLGALAGFWAGGALQQRPTPGPTATRASIGIGDPAPDFALPDLAGVTRSLADFRSRPLLVNFWATWCAPCVEEMPLLDRFEREYRAAGWQVVGLALDGAAPVQEFLARTPVGFAIGLAEGRGVGLSRSLGNTRGALPFSVAINARGEAFARKLGVLNWQELSAWAAHVR